MPKLVYACDHCGQFFAEDKIFEHQDECVYNPKNKKCASCKFCRTIQTFDGVYLINSQSECFLKQFYEQPDTISCNGDIVNIDHSCEYWTGRK